LLIHSFDQMQTYPKLWGSRSQEYDIVMSQRNTWMWESHTSSPHLPQEEQISQNPEQKSQTFFPKKRHKNVV